MIQALAGETAESYRQLGEQTIGYQERNLGFFQRFFEVGVQEARRQTEANLALAQELFEQAEEQREVLQRLTEGAMRAYWGLVLSPVRSVGGAGNVAAREAVAAPVDVPFPIPGYARLSSAQVIEKLDGLSLDELKKVRAYEMEHKNRKGLLAQIEQRIQSDR
ncbi:hypothetical protein GBA65_04085 [Rubrobacter marinus]|uniref:Uncharacterized protein n=1 Tax=Rubrobacter marinus TaxID=2653852 RepID=A0A6G8PU19_9ACTN|nr:hypothetical protein [Rubrobacter marinus]QIN77834.1 hypothetical protein GBA65_04085 [Rubrobacter marinus]